MNAPQDPFGVYKDVTEVLRAWARWRQEGHGLHIDYPSEAPFRRLMAVEGEANLPSALIDDDLAGRVDQAVSQLRLRSKKSNGDYRGAVIMHSYLGGYLDRQIAHHMKLSRSTVRTARMAGENWIEGRLLTS